MKLIIAFVSITLLIGGGMFERKTDAIGWDSTRDWKIYKLRVFKDVFRVPEDSLIYLERRSISIDSVKTFFSKSNILTGEAPLWMGCYLMSFKMSNGKERKLVVSQYGDFVYFPLEGRYYRIEESKKDRWSDFVYGCYEGFFQEEKK